MARQLAQYDQYDVLVLELTDVPQIDFTATRALYDMVHDALEQNREVFLVGAREQVYGMMKKQGVVDAVAAEHLLDRRLDALRAAKQLLAEPPE
ncbi:STAS domain-containing protein [Solemya elarraichensis gill symbiont]|uniref:STAS domain-containing protein n=1 Tax=Solemya elarraichensis gill symbiont TaxID=1918949 RepID=UPI001FE2F085|nr:STAS domain-containing protein [Solemya elarraichensis gill symbiont]